MRELTHWMNLPRELRPVFLEAVTHDETKSKWKSTRQQRSIFSPSLSTDVKVISRINTKWIHARVPCTCTCTSCFSYRIQSKERTLLWREHLVKRMEAGMHHFTFSNQNHIILHDKCLQASKSANFSSFLYRTIPFYPIFILVDECDSQSPCIFMHFFSVQVICIFLLRTPSNRAFV